jgi:hypothetical protein
MHLGRQVKAIVVDGLGGGSAAKRLAGLLEDRPALRASGMILAGVRSLGDERR